MNKRMYGIWILILSVFFTAPLLAAEEHGGTKIPSAGLAGQSSVQKKVKPYVTPSTTTVSAALKNGQHAGRITAVKDKGNSPVAKRPKLIAVQDLAQPKESTHAPVPADVEQESIPAVLSPALDNKQQTPIQSPALQSKVPEQRKMDVPSFSKSQDTPQNKKYRGEEIGKALPKVQDDDHASLREKREVTKVGKILKTAMQSYRVCDFPAAEESAERCLALDPGNQAALTLKSKIAHLREKTEETRIDLAEQCYYRAEGFKREGNILDAMLFAQKALQLNPRLEKAGGLSRTLSESHEEIIKALQGDDKMLFRQAVAEFLKENYSDAAHILRNLQPYCPQLTTMLAVAENHCADKVNSLRSREYYASALDNIYNERYLKAQEDLYLALEMDKYNLDAKQKLLLVNQELGTQRTSAIGQE